MDRKLFGLFTGAQLTIMTCAAIVVPGALYATVTYTPVAIIDPNTGSLAAVDSARRLWTYNPIEAYTNNPGYLVNIEVGFDESGSNTAFYTVPTGKILLIKAITWTFYNNTTGNNNYLYLYDGAGNLLTNFEGLTVAANMTEDFPAPVVAHAGGMYYDYNDGGIGTGGYLYIQGYLVPSSVVPAAGTPESAQQFVKSGKPKRTQ
jgi:hypothetical protein